RHVSLPMPTSYLANIPVLLILPTSCAESLCFSLSFFFNATATPEIYTLSLHDALPIFRPTRIIHCCDRYRWHQFHRPQGCERLQDRKSTRLNSSHVKISYAVFCLKKKKRKYTCIYCTLYN